MDKTSAGAYCDQCLRWFAWSEFVEVIEERLCPICACDSCLEDEDSWIYDEHDSD